MRGYATELELRPSMVGLMQSSVTAVGAPVDTLGFADVLLVLTAGAVAGTEANVNTLTVTVQESDSPTAIGTGWTDITNGAVNGSFKLAIALTSTNPVLYMDKEYERLADGTRKRYLRAHAAVVGTLGTNIKFSAAFLLGRPVDTLYINNATSIASGNTEFTQLKA